jgi:hypothetical protein
MEVLHHRATLCVAAYGFLICEREAIQGCPRAVQPAQIAVATGCAAIQSSVVNWLLKF